MRQVLPCNPDWPGTYYVVHHSPTFRAVQQPSLSISRLWTTGVGLDTSQWPVLFVLFFSIVCFVSFSFFPGSSSIELGCWFGIFLLKCRHSGLRSGSAQDKITLLPMTDDLLRSSCGTHSGRREPPLRAVLWLWEPLCSHAHVHTYTCTRVCTRTHTHMHKCRLSH